MAITETVTDYFRTAIESVTVTMSGGGGYTVDGILDLPYREIEPTDPMVESRYGTFTCAAGDLTSVAEGDTLTYSGVVWLVADIRPDGTGITHLILHLSSGTLPDGPIFGMTEDLGWLASTDLWSEEVSITPVTAAVYTLKGIFEKPYQEPAIGEVSVESTEASFTCRTADLTTVSEGNKLTYSSVDYEIRNIRHDGTGISRLNLHLRVVQSMEFVAGGNMTFIGGNDMEFV